MTAEERVQKWYREAQKVLQKKALKSDGHKAEEGRMRTENELKQFAALYEQGWKVSKIAYELGFSLDRAKYLRAKYLEQKKKSPDDAANITEGDT